jgi:hypothetical protein
MVRIASLFAFVSVTLIAGVVAAEPAHRIPPGQGRYVVGPAPIDEKPAPAQVSPIIYLERCKGGCIMKKAGAEDAKTLSTTLPQGPAGQVDFPLAEFQNSAGQTGAAADAEWNALVQCVKEVYSPFAATVTDVKPTSPTYHVNVVAGIAPDIGMDPNILGVSPGVSCDPRDNRVTYTFANAHGGSGTSRTEHLCWTVAQETAHTYGLDHSYSFPGTPPRSACNDPMTYRTDCGGQRFFRNDQATCGENQPRPCECGINQNSHLKLTTVFGAGTSIIAKPTITVNPPAGGTLGATVSATAYSKRGIGKLELYLNGYKWAETKGNVFGQNGQPEAAYALLVPAMIPNSKYDIKVRALDDIGNFTDSATVTAVKGAPCASADTCLKGQACEDGKCFWAEPTGVIGDACTYPQFCESGICQGTADQQICTQNCIPGVTDSCPAAFQCVESGPGQGVCFFKDEPAGCCSVSDDGVPLAPAALSLGFLGLLLVRRRPLKGTSR